MITADTITADKVREIYKSMEDAAFAVGTIHRQVDGAMISPLIAANRLNTVIDNLRDDLFPTEKNDGGPIAASINRLADGSLVSVGGLSLRDWFAGMALQGIINNSEALAMMSDDNVANNAYTAADAMLSARDRKITP